MPKKHPLDPSGLASTPSPGKIRSTPATTPHKPSNPSPATSWGDVTTPGADVRIDSPGDARLRLYERAVANVQEVDSALAMLLKDIKALGDPGGASTKPDQDPATTEALQNQIQHLKQTNQLLAYQLQSFKQQTPRLPAPAPEYDPKEDDRVTRRRIKRGFVNIRETLKRILDEYCDLDTNPPAPEPVVTRDQAQELDFSADNWPLLWYQDMQWRLLCEEDRRNKILRGLYNFMEVRSFAQDHFGFLTYTGGDTQIERHFRYFEAALRKKGVPPGYVKDWIRATILASEHMTPNTLVLLREPLARGIAKLVFALLKPILVVRTGTEPGKETIEEQVQEEIKQVSIDAFKLVLRMRKARDLFACVDVSAGAKAGDVPFSIAEGTTPVSVLGGGPLEGAGEEVAYGVWPALTMQRRNPDGAAFSDTVSILEKAQVVMDVPGGKERPYPVYTPTIKNWG